MQIAGSGANPFLLIFVIKIKRITVNKNACVPSGFFYIPSAP